VPSPSSSAAEQAAVAVSMTRIVEMRLSVAASMGQQ